MQTVIFYRNNTNKNSGTRSLGGETEQKVVQFRPVAVFCILYSMPEENDTAKDDALVNPRMLLKDSTSSREAKQPHKEFLQISPSICTLR